MLCWGCTPLETTSQFPFFNKYVIMMEMFFFCVCVLTSWQTNCFSVHRFTNHTPSMHTHLCALHFDSVSLKTTNSLSFSIVCLCTMQLFSYWVIKKTLATASKFVGNIFLLHYLLGGMKSCICNSSWLRNRNRYVTFPL